MKRSITLRDISSELKNRFPDFLKKDLELSVKAIFDVASEALKDGRRVQIRGFGSFIPIRKPEKKARNPKTGKVIVVPERVVLKFKPSLELKRKVQKI